MHVIQGLLNLIVQKPRAVTLRLGVARTPEELAAVGALRLRVYQDKLPYLLQELSDTGTDAYDAQSFVFAIWRGSQAVATLRATRYPYETLRYVPEAELAGWLKKGWDTHFVEWGRLVVERTEGINRLAPALLCCAGMYLRANTAYRHYFAYTRPQVRQQSLGGFRTDKDALTFRIPSRGEHHYTLAKGNFLRTLLFEGPRWAGAFLKKMGQRMRRTSPPQGRAGALPVPCGSRKGPRP
ncbi:hypothetical protein [Archangium primigenium]|uniref:hypothetical protein n=1 Tax=[Archangium] primigenium TaxID=2792470 RepID=UPI00195B3414|nr:hypothetical protein [Archangium primigenium]MBM7113756.1 hypothetical protein [Archangium primigenium]